MIASGVGQAKERAHGANASFFSFFSLVLFFFCQYIFPLFPPQADLQVHKGPPAFLMPGGSISDDWVAGKKGIEGKAQRCREERWNKEDDQYPSSTSPRTVRGPNRAYNQWWRDPLLEESENRLHRSAGDFQIMTAGHRVTHSRASIPTGRLIAG